MHVWKNRIGSQKFEGTSVRHPDVIRNNAMKSTFPMLAALLLAPVAVLHADQASMPAGDVSNVPLVLKEGGTAETPFVFDGKGLVIDLGIGVTEHAWKKEGEIWTSSGPLFGREPIAAGQLAGLFLGDVPISLPRDVAAEKLHPELKEHCYLAPAVLKPGQMSPKSVCPQSLEECLSPVAPSRSSRYAIRAPLEVKTR